MMDFLLLPALLSALLSVGLCALRVYRKRRPSFSAVVWSTLAIAMMMLVLTCGSPLIMWSFWRERILEVLCVFGLFALASLIPSVFVVVLYRIRYVDAEDFAEQGAPPNSRPPSQFPASPEVQSPDSQRTSSSGGCG